MTMEIPATELFTPIWENYCSWRIARLTALRECWQILSIDQPEQGAPNGKVQICPRNFNRDLYSFLGGR